MKDGMTRTLISLLALAGVVFVLNDVAQAEFLYWRLWWYDIMMHFLGGFLIGGLAAWGYLRFRGAFAAREFFVWIFVAIMAVGIGWEIFEYLNGWYATTPNVVLDTTIDLIMDTIGAFLAAGILNALRSRQIEEPAQAL